MHYLPGTSCTHLGLEWQRKHLVTHKNLNCPVLSLRDPGRCPNSPDPSVTSCKMDSDSGECPCPHQDSTSISHLSFSQCAMEYLFLKFTFSSRSKTVRDTEPGAGSGDDAPRTPSSPFSPGHWNALLFPFSSLVLSMTVNSAGISGVNTTSGGGISEMKMRKLPGHKTFPYSSLQSTSQTVPVPGV